MRWGLLDLLSGLGRELEGCRYRQWESTASSLYHGNRVGLVAWRPRHGIIRDRNRESKGVAIVNARRDVAQLVEQFVHLETSLTVLSYMPGERTVCAQVRKKFVTERLNVALLVAPEAHRTPERRSSAALIALPIVRPEIIIVSIFSDAIV